LDDGLVFGFFGVEYVGLVVIDVVDAIYEKICRIGEVDQKQNNLKGKNRSEGGPYTICGS
jgi:hypothetical protein